MKKIISILLIIILVVSGCNKQDAINEKKVENNTDYISINDNKGKQNIPSNAKSIVVLDSRAFELISDWNIKISAAPKDIIPSDNPLKNDETISNIGNHKEPNFEILASVNPDLVIVGQRFSQHYDAIKEIVPNAKVIDIDIILDNNNPNSLIDGLVNHTEILGKIFKKENESKKIIDELLNSIKDLENVKTDDSYMGIIVSGKNIGYSAPSTGRVWGPIFDILKLKPSLKIKNSSSDHKGDDISVEAIAESNPDVLLVLDRDASIATEESIPAKDIIENSNTLKNVNAIKKRKIFYAPTDTYTNESIKTYVELFKELKDFINK